ncbi:hypothetical protein VKT23_006600 [Stygiomarasmius scandens]|uniref:Prepronociceptin n=1 Tax=Marasmiellus scandens TaxID=2682957 RepID=A0ABR1JP50_9AGAR
MSSDPSTLKLWSVPELHRNAPWQSPATRLSREEEEENEMRFLNAFQKRDRARKKGADQDQGPSPRYFRK